MGHSKKKGEVEEELHDLVGKSNNSNNNVILATCNMLFKRKSFLNVGQEDLAGWLAGWAGMAGKSCDFELEFRFFTSSHVAPRDFLGRVESTGARRW